MSGGPFGLDASASLDAEDEDEESDKSDERSQENTCAGTLAHELIMLPVWWRHVLQWQ